jgi:cytoskeletal protein CcmA (bactofilin family)
MALGSAAFLLQISFFADCRNRTARRVPCCAGSGGRHRDSYQLSTINYRVTCRLDWRESFVEFSSMFSRKKQPPIKSLIAQGTRIEGSVHFAEGMRIDGEVVGDIRAGSEQPSILVISELARVEGAVHADHVIINGQVVGPVHAGELLELQPKAKITGNVHYKALEMHQGAVIAGQMCPVAVLVEEKPPLKLASNSQ